MAEIISQFLGSVTYWPGDSPGQGEKGKESTRTDSGSGSVECTGSSKEGSIEDLSLHSRLHSSSTCTRIK